MRTRSFQFVIAVGIFGSQVLLSGCSALLFHPSAKPVIEDHIGKQHNATDKADADHRIGTLATVAQRRLVLVRYKDAHFCAEPSPDAADNISSALTAALEVEREGLGKASGELATTFASIAKQFSYRSQGLQLYRDGMFALCNAYLNGAIVSEAEWTKRQDKLLDATVALIAAEIPLMPNAQRQGEAGKPTP